MRNFCSNRSLLVDRWSCWRVRTWSKVGMAGWGLDFRPQLGFSDVTNVWSEHECGIASYWWTHVFNLLGYNGLHWFNHQYLNAECWSPWEKLKSEVEVKLIFKFKLIVSRQPVMKRFCQMNLMIILISVPFILRLPWWFAVCLAVHCLCLNILKSYSV